MDVLVGRPENLRFWDNLAHPENNPFFATTPFPHNTTHPDFIEGVGLLTAARVRHIRFLLSWRPASADNGHWAKVPENHANIALSGQNDLLING
jgi:hypothetical protein